MSEKRPSFWQSARDVAAVYILWVIVSVVLLFCLIVARDAVTAVFRLITLDHWVIGAIEKFNLFILGLIGLVIVIFAENYLREGVPAGKLYKRFAIFLGAEAVSYGLLRLIQDLAWRALPSVLK